MRWNYGLEERKKVTAGRVYCDNTALMNLVTYKANERGKSKRCGKKAVQDGILLNSGGRIAGQYGYDSGAV